jgi:hypothetical protein
MAHRIDEHAEARLPCRWDPSRTKRHNCAFGLVDILDTDIEVQLLRMVGVWPARRHPLGSSLERELARPGLDTDNDPVAKVMIYLHPEHRGVELGERSRLRAVDHGLLEASDHITILLGFGRGVDPDWRATYRRLEERRSHARPREMPGNEALTISRCGAWLAVPEGQ